LHSATVWALIVLTLMPVAFGVYSFASEYKHWLSENVIWAQCFMIPCALVEIYMLMHLPLAIKYAVWERLIMWIISYPIGYVGIVYAGGWIIGFVLRIPGGILDIVVGVFKLFIGR
jgi:hypothetical protein